MYVCVCVCACVCVCVCVRVLRCVGLFLSLWGGCSFSAIEKGIQSTLRRRETRGRLRQQARHAGWGDEQQERHEEQNHKTRTRAVYFLREAHVSKMDLTLAQTCGMG